MTPDVTGFRLFFALILVLVTTWFAVKAGFYTLPPKKELKSLNFKELLGAFLTYLSVSVIFLPLMVVIARYYSYGSPFTAELKLPTITALKLQLIAFGLIMVAMIYYLTLIKKESAREVIWQGKKENSAKNFGVGVLTLLVSYPMLLFVSLIMNYISLHLFGKSGIEQTMVKQMKELTHHPTLFVLMAVAIIFVAPFVEELLFRGFLQSYVRKYWGRGWAILISSVLFALAHFVKGGGVGNIELLVSLSVLAFYLGFLYERQQSLVAPFALHMTFNATTILAIAAQ